MCLLCAAGRLVLTPAVALPTPQGVLFHEGQSFGVVPPVRRLLLHRQPEPERRLAWLAPSRPAPAS